MDKEHLARRNVLDPGGRDGGCSSGLAVEIGPFRYALTIHPGRRPTHHVHHEVLRRPIDSTQYTSADYARLARDHQVVLSVGRKGQCWDCPVAESFFATIKREVIDTHP